MRLLNNDRKCRPVRVSNDWRYLPGANGKPNSANILASKPNLSVRTKFRFYVFTGDPDERPVVLKRIKQNGVYVKALERYLSCRERNVRVLVGVGRGVSDRKRPTANDLTELDLGR